MSGSGAVLDGVGWEFSWLIYLLLELRHATSSYVTAVYLSVITYCATMAPSNCIRF